MKSKYKRLAYCGTYKCGSCKYFGDPAERHTGHYNHCFNPDSEYSGELICEDDWCEKYVGSETGLR